MPSVGYLERLFNNDNEDIEEVKEVKRPRFKSTSTPLTSFEMGSGRKQRLRLEKATKILPGLIEAYKWDVAEEEMTIAAAAAVKVTANRKPMTEKINKERPTTEKVAVKKATTHGEIDPTVSGEELSKACDLVANKKRRGRKPSMKRRKAPYRQSSTRGDKRRNPPNGHVENKEADEENIAKKVTMKVTKKVKKVTFDSLAKSRPSSELKAKTSDLKKNEASKEATPWKYPPPTESRNRNAPPDTSATKRRLRSNKTALATVVRKIQKSKKQKAAVKTANSKLKPVPLVNEPVHHLSKNKALKQSICHSSFLHPPSMPYTELLAACRKSFDPMDILLLTKSAISC